MMKKSIFYLAILAAIPAAIPARAVAETDFSKFGLSRAAPADAFITVAARGNPERDFLKEYWGGVSQAFWESGIVTDLWDMVTEEVPDENLAEIEELKERFTELCGKVGWDELFEKEMLYSGRFANLGPSAPPMYEGMVLGRMKDTETASKNYEAVHAILTELAKLTEAKPDVPNLVVTTESRKDGLTLAKASFAEIPFMEFNVGLRKDVIIITFGSPKILADALANLSDDKEAKRIVETPRFASAFSKLPAAEDTLVFFDVERMMSTFRGMATMIEKMGGPAGDNADSQPSEQAMVGKILGQILSDASIVDYMATVQWTDGHRAFAETRTAVRDGGTSSPLFNVIGGNKSIDDFAKYVPREATSFSVSSGFDIAALYDYLVNFIEKNIPDGKDAIAEWNRLQQEQFKLDVKKDILSLIEGTSFSVSLGNDSVAMTRLTDEKKADAQIKRLVDFIKQNVGPDQGLSFVPVKVGPEQELLQLSHPMLMLQGASPVFGCADGYFIISSSSSAVKTCLLTGRGKHANIKESGPWKAQALMPDGPVSNITFTNQSNMAQELQQQISMLSMGIGFLQIGVPNMPPPAQKIVTAASKILPKLLPVAGKMNFFKSKAGYTTFDGSAWTTRNVQNYKSPAEVKKLEGDSDESSDAK
ncbi:MAG: hypothetical protein H6819_00390 [Phycisphaerales bacterium]|nr:hypothetical protein [Phycisphaerales bacterium]MCB9857333.1 hypothetical protein [Phycisphaerales bacterium]MCB9862953.1 hypothetical protein [Phycisphaerales bacterium]